MAARTSTVLLLCGLMCATGGISMDRAYTPKALRQIAVALQEAAPVLGQAHRMVAVPGHARGLDQPLFAQVSEVAGRWISRAPIVVSEITTGDHSECTDGRERPRFGAAQGVLAITVMNQFALWSRWQVSMAGECIRDLAIAVSIVAISVGPAGIVIALTSVPV